MEPSQSCLRRNELIPVKHVSWAWLIVSKGWGGALLFIYLAVPGPSYGTWDL